MAVIHWIPLFKQPHWCMKKKKKPKKTKTKNQQLNLERNSCWIRKNVFFVLKIWIYFPVLVVMSALLTYPLGFGSPFFRYYCGAGAGPYDTGQCSVGWSFMLAIMGVSLSVFCPILWSFRWIKRDDFMDEMLV